MQNLNHRTIMIYVFILSWLFCFFILILNVKAPTVYLEDIDSGTTSPTGVYRWLDVANQAYCSDYRDNYNYTQATVEIEYNAIGETLNGVLNAFNLKPNFAYQLKLVGTPGIGSNEKIGLAGRWWQEEWNGSAWINGQNLNNKGNGSSPNPNDNAYFTRKNITDPTSPTGYKYKYTGYLVFDYFITDENGNVTINFETNSSYHVLWKTTQRIHSVDDGLIKSTTFNVNASSPAYDVDYPVQTIDIFGEWERLPVGGMFLQPGNYSSDIILTEESFHGEGGSYSGNWAGAMGKNINFIIADVYVNPLNTGWNIISVPCYDTIYTNNIVIRNNSIEYNWSEAVSNGIILTFLYNYNRTTQIYEFSDHLKPGYGYWIWAFYSCDFIINGINVGTGYITDMQDAWNIIGHSYNNTIHKTNIIITNNSVDYTWDNAVAEGIILGFIYGWDNTNHMYELCDNFTPGRGYWIYAYEPCTLKKIIN